MQTLQEKDERKTLTNTIFIGDSDLNGAGWFCPFSHIGHYSGSPAFQPFMPIEIFPDSSEPCENTDGQKQEDKKWNQNCCKCPDPVDVSDNVVFIESEVCWNQLHYLGFCTIIIPNSSAKNELYNYCYIDQIICSFEARRHIPDIFSLNSKYLMRIDWI